MHTHYDNLQISRNANHGVIRAAYRVLSQQYHPDKNLTNFAQANQTMKIINEAFEVLSDPLRRAQHDAWIAQQELSATRKQNAETSNAFECSTDQTYCSAKQAESNTGQNKESNEAKFRSCLYKDAEARFNFIVDLKKKYFG